MNQKAKARLSRAPEAAILGVAILIVLAVGGLSYINVSQTRARILKGRVTRDIQKLNAQLLLTVTSAETGQRGFLLTGQEQYLDPYRLAIADMPSILNRLKTRSVSLPDQAQRIRAVEPLVTAKLAELQKAIEFSRSNRLADALALVNTNEGKNLMDQIRLRCAEINEVTEARAAEFNAASDLSASRLRIGSMVASILLLGLVFISALIISQGFRRREELFHEAQSAREVLAITLSSIADAVISTDAQARVTFMNAIAQQLTGWTQEHGAGKRISEVFCIVSESTGEIVPNPLDRALAQGHAVGLANHTKLISRSGEEISIDDSAAPIRNPDGDIIGAVLVFRDISEKRRSELDLAASAAALKRSNEELQQFAFAASHDLRSPLNSVNSIAQLLAKRFGPSLGEEGHEMISYITDGLGRMSRLIEDLLSLALASSIAQQVTHPTNMDDAFQAAVRGLSAEIQATGASITCGPLPSVAAHDTHVIQILQNVLGNALKYRGKDTPRISVSAAFDGSAWIVSVKDNGIGFDPKYAEQIFQPFKRLHGHEYEGSGIGLSTCKKIVSVYGGRIWAESEADKGSTFFFTLPPASQLETASEHQVAAVQA